MDGAKNGSIGVLGEILCVFWVRVRSKAMVMAMIKRRVRRTERVWTMLRAVLESRPDVGSSRKRMPANNTQNEDQQRDTEEEEVTNGDR